jgi:hypothetical protein
MKSSASKSPGPPAAFGWLPGDRLCSPALPSRTIDSPSSASVLAWFAPHPRAQASARSQADLVQRAGDDALVADDVERSINFIQQAVETLLQTERSGGVERSGTRLQAANGGLIAREEGGEHGKGTAVEPVVGPELRHVVDENEQLRMLAAVAPEGGGGELLRLHGIPRSCFDREKVVVHLARQLTQPVAMRDLQCPQVHPTRGADAAGVQVQVPETAERPPLRLEILPPHRHTIAAGQPHLGFAGVSVRTEHPPHQPGVSRVFGIRECRRLREQHGRLRRVVKRRPVDQARARPRDPLRRRAMRIGEIPGQKPERRGEWSGSPFQ